MSRIDELLGIATVAAAGMFVAISLAPMPSGVPHPDDELAVAPVASTAVPSAAAPTVRLAPIEVVARRSVELARIEREEKSTRQHPSNGGRPKA